MSQNINLFGPAFRKERHAVTLKSLSLVILATLAVLTGAQAYLSHDLAGLAEESRSADALLKVQRRYVETLQGESARGKQDKALEAETARLEADLKQARDVMGTLEGGAIGMEAGFSEFLRALSRQSAQGLWLTAISVDGRGEIELRGRALSPDLMPGYIQRLTGERVLAGRSFNRLEISQPQPDKSRNADRDRDAKLAARVPKYLEFSLATAASATEKSP